VDIYDLSEELNCSGAAAGLLAPLAELEKGDALVHQLGCDALMQYWPDIITQLKQEIYFKIDGSLMLAHARDRQELQRFAALITARLKQPAAIRYLDQQQLSLLEPDLGTFKEGYFFPAEGQIDSQQILAALSHHLDHTGVTRYGYTRVLHTAAHRIELSSGTRHYDLVIDCRGLGARTHFAALRSLRGELVWLHASDVRITRPVRLLHPRYGLYIVPRPDQTYLIGASEIESEDHSSISVRTMLELLTAASCVHPGFLEARIIKTITQCRPALSHHRPEIKTADGLIAINGLYRHGFLIAPALAAIVMNWIESGKEQRAYPEIWKEAA
jgi:glycine oxidase